ncbi:hypothetical protein GCM10017784_36780 [Deinococcus indicus]|nr:hypothetical protein GCM10017784_36780 [Deinococcus indicus]
MESTLYGKGAASRRPPFLHRLFPPGTPGRRVGTGAGASERGAVIPTLFPGPELRYGHTKQRHKGDTMNKIRSLLTILALLIAAQPHATAGSASTPTAAPISTEPVDQVWPPIWWPGS